jgi:hypothetical protein
MSDDADVPPPVVKRPARNLDNAVSSTDANASETQASKIKEYIVLCLSRRCACFGINVWVISIFGVYRLCIVS